MSVLHHVGTSLCRDRDCGRQIADQRYNQKTGRPYEHIYLNEGKLSLQMESASNHLSLFDDY